jgi:hypothetical protein
MKYKTQCWVHPDFKKKLQNKALDMDMSLLEFTEHLASKAPFAFDTIKPPNTKKGRRKRRYEFTI